MHPVLIRGLILGVVLGLIAYAVGFLAIDPGIGEGDDLDPNSLRYRVGVGLEPYAAIVILVCAWPALFLVPLRAHRFDIFLDFICSLVAGIGWAFLWHWVRHSFRISLPER